MADETNNKNAVFKFYLNRQGVKGNKGEKGDQGFSPIIEVSENTAASYKLQITTETDQIETPNLRGNAVEDLGGTYMRYNRENQTMYASTADVATTSSQGEVTLASDEAIANLSDTNVLTPAGIVDNATSLFQSLDGSIAINQDENTGKINLATHNQASQTDVDALTLRVGTCEDNIGDNAGRIQTLENNLALDEQAIQDNTLAIGNKVDKVAGKGLSTNDFTDADKSKLDSSLQPTSVDGTTIGLNSGGQLTLLAQIPTVPTNISAFTNDSGYITSSALNGYATENFVTSQGYITSSALTPYVLSSSLATVATTGDYADLINTPTAYSSGLGIDINNANQISVKVDGTTVAYNLNGELTASGGGGTVDQTYDATSANAQSGAAIAGAGFLTSSDMSNYLTTNTAQTVTGTKTFQNAELILKSGTYSKFNLENEDGNNLRPESQTSTGLMHFAYNNAFNVATISSNRTLINGNVRGLLRILPTTNYSDSSIEGYIMTHNLVDMSYKPFLTASKITSTGGTVTITDNGMNGINIEAVGGGGGGTPTNMVTTDTAQDITANKNFQAGLTLVDSNNNATSLNLGNSDYHITRSNTNSPFIEITSEVSASSPIQFKVGREGYGSYAGVGGYFFDTRDGGNCVWLGETNYRSCITTTSGQSVQIYPNPFTNNAQERLRIGVNDVLTYRKADGTEVDLLNPTANLDNTKFDGQWVYPSTATVANRVAATTTHTSYDLSSILPNDNYNYEVIFSGYALTGNVAGNRVAVEIQGITDALMCGMTIRTAASQTIYGSCVVVIGTNRTATVLGVTNPNGDYTINITGYRRMGTNS